MFKPITNVHIHIFNASCAPDRFFMVLPNGVVRLLAKQIKSALMTKAGDLIIKLLSSISSIRQRSRIARYIAFINIGSQKRQLDIFRMALEVGKQYDSMIRFVGLTMNMDHMDSQASNHKKFETQLEEVKDIKRYYPDQFFPFLGIDPRQKSGPDLRDWAKAQLEIGFKHKNKIYPYFSGLKIYPAQGFFPFDPALDELYAYAEEYGIPIMTHCTRGGSQYIGEYIEQLIPEEPRMIQPLGLNQLEPDDKTFVNHAIEAIKKRIEAYYKEGWIRNNELGNNDYACDLFTHPQNYIPVLAKYPALKLCLAHMGGLGEFYKTSEIPATGFGELKVIRAIDTTPWTEIIQKMMIRYFNLYSDISYTVNYFSEDFIVERFLEFGKIQDSRDQQLHHRILFGTDFFMTEQEKKEGDLYSLLLKTKKLDEWMEGICRENVLGYMGW